ncbi:hypothetical protein BC830DRAFT_1086680 [Chytriomyces sp. MP71]|nr:hypothetical protein BC830DRAFT_1086680 [Chytriomyces sp. MP71]
MARMETNWPGFGGCGDATNRRLLCSAAVGFIRERRPFPVAEGQRARLSVAEVGGEGHRAQGAASARERSSRLWCAAVAKDDLVLDEGRRGERRVREERRRSASETADALQQRSRLVLSDAPRHAALVPRRVRLHVVNEFQLLHSVGVGNKFAPRGRIAPVETRPNAFKHEADAALLLANVAAPADHSHTLYNIMAVSMDGTVLTASVPLCQLQSAQLRDSIAIHVDHTGKPFHLDYNVDAQPGACTKAQKPLAPNAAFKTKVVVSRAEDGARPRLELMSPEKGAEGGKETEKSFLQKYWYYIVPLMLVLMLSGGEPDAAATGAPAAAKK